jgi:dolichol-phosphate mannosyltransferase
MARPHVSVVIPTRNEADNVLPLLTSLGTTMEGIPFEAIFADDSTDQTPTVVKAASRECRFDVRLLHRAEPTGGLGGAVVEGIQMARARLVVVMDADLQHPPELVPMLYSQACNGDADIVVASRYMAGGHAAGLAGHLRHLGSRSTTLLAKLVFPRRLRRCSDPMTGFFCLDTATVDLGELRPQGFKILLEMIVRSGARVSEIPMVMGSRTNGESKAGVREALRFLKQLFILRFRSAPIRFALVGLTGALLNLAILAALTSAGTGLVAAAIIAVQAATIWNFAGTELLVFHDRRVRSWWHRAIQFELVGATDVLRIPFVVMLTHAGLGPVPGSAITLVAAFVARYALLEKVVYRKAKRVARDDDAFSPARRPFALTPQAADGDIDALVDAAAVGL